MLVIFFLVFGGLVSASLISLQTSYLDQIETYRGDVRMHHAQIAFSVADRWGQRLGVLPPDVDKLTDLVSLELGSASNYVLEDFPGNVHLPHLHYVRSSERGSIYESDRAALLIGPPNIEVEETILSTNGNFCDSSNRDFKSGYSWCENPAGTPGYEVYRTNTQVGVALAVAEQESEVRSLASKVSSYLSYKLNHTDDAEFPPTVSTDAPIYNSVKVGSESGASFNPDSDCSGKLLFWGEIPVTCRDLFASWHIDSNGSLGSRAEIEDLYGLDTENRFNVPAYAYRPDSETMIIYVETPFNRYPSGAWSSTSLRRGEQRPNGSPSYIYTQLSKARHEGT